MNVVIDSGLGNIGSILNMSKRIGHEATASSDPEFIKKAKKLILPGVGAFDYGMKRLSDIGIRQVLDQMVITGKTPLLGICLGMQLLFDSSEEGSQKGLGWIPGRVTRFTNNNRPEIKIPHMGWNTVEPAGNAGLFKRLEGEIRFYFTHSYFAACTHSEDVTSFTDHGGKFASSVNRNNIYGVQFHPEKSHKFGMKVLDNFYKIDA